MSDVPTESLWLPNADLARRVDAATAEWQQGDIAIPGFTVHLGDRDQPLSPEGAKARERGGGVGTVVTSAEAVAVVTQTCDVVRGCSPDTDNRPYVQVSPVVRLTGDALRNARAGRSPRYAAVPGYGDDAFADLDHCTTVEKTLLAGSRRLRGCPDDQALLEFAAAAARHRARFAFPDEVEHAMSGLKRRMTDRTDRNSPEGHRVDELRQIRVAATPRWDDPDGYSIELTYIVGEDYLGAVDPEDQVSDRTREFLGRGPSDREISTRLENSDLTTADRSALWMALAAEWTKLVAASEVGRILEVRGTAESEATYSLARENRSARLDLDHLSRGRG